MSQSRGKENTAEVKGFEVQCEANLSQIEAGDHMVLSQSDRDPTNSQKDVNPSQKCKDLSSSQQLQICSDMTYSNSQKDLRLSQISKDPTNSQKELRLSQICKDLTNSQKDLRLSQICKDLTNSQKDLRLSQICKDLTNSQKDLSLSQVSRDLTDSQKNLSNLSQISKDMTNNDNDFDLSLIGVDLPNSQKYVNLSQIDRDLTNNQKDVDTEMNDVIIIDEELDIKKEKDLSAGLSDDTSCTLMSSCLPDVITREQINHIDCLRMRNSLTEILEEVKLRRNNDVENEDRIRQLVQEKHDLERKLDREQLRLVSLQEDQEKKSAEIKHQFEDKIKVLQAEVKQNQVFRDCVEKETNALKDDIRNLQITNYNLEKKLREQGTKLQLQVTSANQHLNQLSSAEDKFKAVSNYCKKLSESQERLKKNVNEAVKLNRDLMYTNEHQKCILDEQKGEINLLQGQLLDMKVKLDSKPLDNSKIEHEEEITALKEQLQNEKDEQSEIKKELNRTSCNYKETLVQLQDSYDLIERHLQNAEAHEREATTLSTELEECTNKMKKLENALDSLKKELNIEKTVHHQSVETWKEQEKELRLKLTSLSENLEKEKSAKMDLEQLNTVWSEQNFKLSEELTELKAILNVPKEDGIYQTELTMLDMINTGCQVQPELSVFGSQTEYVRRYSITSQTEPPPCSDAVCQTFAPALAVSSTQTKEPPLVNRGAQTDKMSDDSLGQKRQNTTTKYHNTEVQTEKDFDWSGNKPISSDKSENPFHEEECKDMNGRKEFVERVDINDGQSSISNTFIKDNQSNLAGQNSNFETSQSTVGKENEANITGHSDHSSSKIDQSKSNEVSTEPTENDTSGEPVSDKGDNSNVVDVDTEKNITRKGIFSLSKDFVKAYNTKEEVVNDINETSKENHEEKIEKVNENISTSTNMSENLELMKNDGNGVIEVVTNIKKKETNFDLIDEQGDRSGEKNKLIEKPKKLSLYESQLDGYLSKITSGNMQQNAVGVKLIKPRDDQDAPRNRKYVEFLQPMEKSNKQEEESLKPKFSSPSGRSSLSLGKKRFKTFSDNVSGDTIESRNNSKDSKSPENRSLHSGQLQNASENVPDLSADNLRSKYSLRNTESSAYKSYLPLDKPDASDLSPYSRYRTFLKSTSDATEKNINIERSRKQKDKKRGILKEFVIEVPSEKDRKNVTFSEQMIHVKHMSPEFELSGDQSLFSDDEQDDVEIEIVQSPEDCTAEKRPRLD